MFESLRFYYIWTTWVTVKLIYKPGIFSSDRFKEVSGSGIDCFLCDIFVFCPVRCLGEEGADCLAFLGLWLVFCSLWFVYSSS